jgi:Protein of unknown function (DUF3152)
MIDSRPSAAEPVAPAPRPGRRPWLAAGLVVAASLLVGAVQLAHAGRTPPVPARVPAALSSSPSLPPAPFPLSAPASAAPAPGLLRMPGAAPVHGTGRFSYAAGRGRVLGAEGPVRHFRVAVEQGSGEDVAAFAGQVEATLGDARSWVGERRLRLQRVPGSEEADFTVYLATRDTADAMCQEGGTDITDGAQPYTSCRTTGRAIINLDRWRLSSPPYVAAGVPLAAYRQYVVNHEVGHELGHHHEGCPRRGGPAPVMVQQTLTLRGCVPYPWPFQGGHRLAGPPV